MKNNKKNLWLITLATTLGLSFLGCNPNSGTTTGTTGTSGIDSFDFDTVSNATLWKDYDKAAFGGANAIKQVVVSGQNTYVSTDDRGLWVSVSGAAWKKVDLAKGIAPAAVPGSPAIAEAGVNIVGLTALSGGRVIFKVDGGADGVIIAEGDVAKRTWAPNAAVPAGADVSFLAATGTDNKERIFATSNDNLALIFMQLDSADAALTAAWNVSIEASDNIFVSTPGNRIKQLTLNHDGSSLVFSKEQLFSYDTLAKAQWGAGGKSVAAHAVAGAIKGHAAATWKPNAAMPRQIVLTAAAKAVAVNAAGTGVLWVSDTTGAAGAGANAPLALATVTAVHKLIKDGATNVLAFTDKGVFTIDGAAGTLVGTAFTGAFTGDNYKDEGKTAVQLEALKKTDLTVAAFATTDIRDMAKSAGVTYYLTDKGVFAGKTGQTLKLNKRAKK